MKAGKIIDSIKRTENISEDVIEELHQLISKQNLCAARSATSTWQYRAIGLTLVQSTDEDECGRIDDAVLEKMYRHYISHNKKPGLTFSEYSAVIENIIGRRAA